MNVHTGAHPDGEIRGQIRVPTDYVAELDGNEEVPPVDTQAPAAATLRLSADETTLELLPGRRRHRCRADPAGPPARRAARLQRTGGALPHRRAAAIVAAAGRSCGAADLMPAPDSGVTDFADFVEALRAGDVYANVHTDTHPTGEIRGQVQAAIELPALAAGTAAAVHARFVVAPDRNTKRRAAT